MLLSFINPQVINEEQIKTLEKKINFLIPENLKNFLFKNSNSIPSINGSLCCFKNIHANGWVQDNFIEKIISLENAVSEFEDRNTLDLYFKDFKLSKDFVEIEYLFPFALTPNGVLYYSIGGIHLGKIYFADCGDFGLLFQAINFENFWESVYVYTK